MEFRNEWEFRVFGMKRSGHHAIIVWLASLFRQRSVHFINDVLPFHNPFVCHSNTEATTSRSTSFIERPEAQIVLEQAMRKHCLIYSYEDTDLTSLARRNWIPSKLENIGSSAKEITVFVLRDPFNILASRLKSRFQDHKSFVDRTLADWIIYANEFAGYSNYLGPKLLISFNRWFRDEAYRRSIATQLGLPFNDLGLNRVAANGDGSSWDGVRLDKLGQQMKVLDRWRTYVRDTQFRKMFEDREDVRSLSGKIFGAISGTDALFAPLRNISSRFTPNVRLSAMSTPKSRG